MRTKLEITNACHEKDIELVVSEIQNRPDEKRLLEVLFTEDTGEFVKTIRSIIWQLHHAKKSKTNWSGGFVLHRKGRVRMYGLNQKIKKAP